MSGFHNSFMKKIITILILFLCLFKLSAQTDTRAVKITPVKDTSVFHGNIYAVIVGVSNYKYVKPLSFADQDALLFRDFLQSKAGGNVKADNIFLALNQDATASTQPRIRKWLTETKKIQKGDRVYFYFAGHGDAINSDEYFFLLQDCNPGGDKNNYTGGMASVIQMYNIKSLIKNDLVNNGVDVILIWDACRTNELPGGETGLQNMQTGIAEKTDGESIMLSASAGEVALENSTYAHGHGLFTYYLIDGLSGAADNTANDGNGDGKVDMRELEDWVKRKVRNDAKTKFNQDQDPRFIYNTDQTLSIVDSSFENDWAMKKMAGSDLALNYQKTGKGTGRNMQEADSLIVELYNRFMAAVKEDSLAEGQNSAEELYKQLLMKYPDNSLTEQAGFNLAMEYINLAQDKINLYLSGKDDLTLLATPKTSNENPNNLNHALILSSGKNYGKNARYLYRALELLKKDTISDVNYMKQLQAKADFLASRSYISNEGIITDFSKALELAKAAMSIQPQAAYNYLLFGSLYYINRQYDSSIYYERKALSLAPNWVNALNNLGLVFDVEKKYDSAQYYYRKAIEINPDYLSPYGNLSYNFSSRQIYDSAYKYSREAVALNPFYTGGYNSLGIIFHFQKKYDSAKIYYYKSISLDPRYASAYCNLGILYYSENQFDSSKIYYQKTISIDPKYTDAYYNLGFLFFDQKQYDSAALYYHKTISIDPRYTDAYIGLGTMFMYLKQFDSSAVYYHKCLHIDSVSTYANYNLGVLSSDRKRYDSAIYYYHRAIIADPHYANAYNGLGNLFVTNKKYDSAGIYYHKAISLDRDFTDAYYNLGYLFMVQNQNDSAKIYYNKTLAIDTRYTKAYNGLGNASMIDKKYDSAAIYFHQATSIDPRFADGYYNLGFLFYSQKNYDSSKYFFYKSVNIDSEYTNGYNGLGNCFFQQKIYDSAIVNFQKVIKLDSLNVNANTLLSACLLIKNNTDSSAYFLKKLILNKIANQFAFVLGSYIISSYQNNKMYDKELNMTRLLYNYDSVFNVPGVDSIHKKDLLYKLAYSYLFTGNHAAGKYYYEKAGALSYYYYNFACIASLDKKIKEAIENLELSFQNGYNDYDHIQKDTDLDNIRSTEEFKQLIKKYFPDKPG